MADGAVEGDEPTPTLIGASAETESSEGSSQESEGADQQFDFEANVAIGVATVASVVPATVVILVASVLATVYLLTHERTLKLGQTTFLPVSAMAAATCQP